MIKIRVNLAQLDQLKRPVKLAQELLRDLSPVFDEVIHPWMLAHMARQFGSGGSWGGKPWGRYESEPKYAGMKKALVGHTTPLRWEPGRERLYPSLVQPTHPEHLWESDRASARFGTRVPWAADLQRGGIGPYGEPYRPYAILQTTDAQRRGLAKRVEKDIMRRING